jgi:hypothetical protein
MVHDKRDVEGRITVTLDAEDWVWLCELLAEVANSPETDMMLGEDVEHALSALGAFENGT